MVRADNKIDTSTTVKADPIVSVYGQPITLTATVTASSTSPYTPGGSVIFNVVGYGQVTGQLDDNGKATAVLGTVQLGMHVIFATYNGDPNFNMSVSPIIIQTVNHASTVMDLSSSTDTSVYGEPVTLTATVTPAAPGKGVPTGSVVFSISGYGSIVKPLDESGVAAITIDTLDLGNYVITSTYSGDSDFYPSVSSPVNLTVNQALTATALKSSSNPSDYGQAVTFTASVTPVSPGVGTPTGTVIFIVDGTASALSTLLNGEATYSPEMLTIGEHTMSVQYSGDSNFMSSSSQPLIQNVRIETMFSLLSSKNPSNRNDSVTFTTSGLPDVATGTVMFFDGGTELGSSEISEGKAEFTAQPFSSGDHIITAYYSGDNIYSSSTSPDFTQTVSTLYSYTVRYIDLLSGESIAPDVHGSGQLGEEITITAPEIEGYLPQGSSGKTFTINAGSNSETFSYISITSIVILLVIVNLIVGVLVLIILRVSS